MTDPGPRIRLTWWGHATLHVEDGARLLTDPVLTQSFMHLYRRAGVAPRRLVRDVDAVLLSHLHADDLHGPSLQLLTPNTPALVPRGAASLLNGLPVTPVEVAAGDRVRVGDATVTVVPAVHDDRRWPWSRVRGKPVGYLIEGHGSTYFAGDTGSVPDLRDVTPDIDAAALPVGGWGPWLRGEHLDPRRAAEALPGLLPTVAVPVHYGTFWPRGLSWLRRSAFDDPGRDFAVAAAVLAPGVEVRVLYPGMSTMVGVDRA